MSQDPQDDDGPLREQLVAYLDGELSVEENRQIEQRAAAEPGVRRMLEDFDRTWQLLDELDTPATNEDFTRTTLEMVALAAADDAAKIKSEAPRRRRRVWLSALCGLVGAAAVGFLLAAGLSRGPLDPNAQLLSDLPLLVKLDQYREIDSIEFLRELYKADLFTKDDVAAAPTLRVDFGETIAERRQEVEKMKPDELEDLSHNEQSFLQDLGTEKQEHLRKLYEAIEKDPQRDKLLAVMNRYTRWFEEQLPSLRSELQRQRKKTPEERIAEIKKDLKNQQITGNEIRLDDKNRKVVVRWMTEYIKAHEHDPRFNTAIASPGLWGGMGRPPGGAPPGKARPNPGPTPLGPTPPGGRSPAGTASTAARPNTGSDGEPAAGLIAKLPDTTRQHAVREVFFRDWQRRDPIFHPSASELASLLSKLSPDIRERLQKRKPDEQTQIIAGWLRETASAVRDEQLANYFEDDLARNDRDRLMSLPGDEIYRELGSMYWTYLITQSKPGEPLYSGDRGRGDHRPGRGGGRFGGRDRPENPEARDPQTVRQSTGDGAPPSRSSIEKPHS